MQRSFFRCLALLPLLLLPLVALAQNRLSGVVVDSDGEPVIGASVAVSGTTKGAITDLDGKFTLSVEKGQDVVFSSIGFEDQVLRFQGQQDVRIVLETAMTTLDEVVKIQEEGRAKRLAAENELGLIEAQLKQKLLDIRNSSLEN